MQITHPQTLVTALFLGAYALGFRYGVPAAMLPWQVRTWVCLVALLFGAVKSSGTPLALALCVDCIALLVMIQADDKVTLAVFALTMIGAYSLRP